ncbi:MAG TPA: hypothetical protein VNG13_03080 [Mycobacteriales bacterium]|nr:hypothetical protein [Mycobacteriales bacterium]
MPGRRPRLALGVAVCSAVACSSLALPVPASANPNLIMAVTAGTAPAAVVEPGGSLDVLDRNTAGYLEAAHWTASGGWAGVSDLGGQLAGGPAVAVDPVTGAVDVFVQGPDHLLFEKVRSNGTWSGWQNLGGWLTGRPAAVADPATSTVAVAVAGGGGAVYLKIHAGGVWSRWIAAGGSLLAGTGPAITRAGTGLLLLAGVHTTHVVYTETVTVDGALGSWRSIGGYAINDPTAVSSGGEPVVFTEAGNRTLQQATGRPAGGFGPWVSVQGNLGGGAGAASGAGTPQSGAAGGATSSRIDVFVLGPQAGLWQRTSTAGSWGAWRLIALPGTSPPAWTSSHYTNDMTGDPGTDAGLGYDHGCARAQSGGSGLVVLDYGTQTIQQGVNGTWKVLAYGVFLSDADIVAHADGYLRGYVACSNGAQPGLILALGTNNSGPASTTGGPAGVDWATNVVNAVARYAASNGGTGISVGGANDIEPGFGVPSAALAWTQGYDSATGFPSYDYGSADGCPGIGDPSTVCGDGWTIGQLWSVSDGVATARALPEIYTSAQDQLTQGSQWAHISLWGTQQGHPAVPFAGEMTQWESCQQEGGCADTGNTPAQGWWELWNDITGQPQTRIAALPYSTDIMHDQ